MKYLISAVLLGGSAALALPANMTLLRRDVDPALVPPFGITPGTNPTGTGDCDGTIGPNGQPIKIPCACPPSLDVFLPKLNANVAAGHATNNPVAPVAFPTDNSQASQIARIQAVLVTLQNLNGPGQGCPAASTTLLALQKSIQDGSAPPPASGSSAPPPSNPPPANNNNDTVEQLAPPLGFSSGVNPTGTGDCDGAVGSPPIKIPCSCPPAQDEYIAQLKANVAAGHAVNNPSVAVTFPTDQSPASQRARITAALITVQNLKGPGVGCPAVSTTLQAQQAAIQG